MMVTIHNGARFRLDYNPLFNSSLLVHKASGRSAYMNSEGTWQFRDAVGQFLSFAPASASFDDCYSWVWTNAGFHRRA